jgi:hypothetical protein
MADSIVGGLFGVSPEQLAQQRQARDYEQQMLAGRSAAMPGSMMSPSLAPFYQQATQEGQLIGRGVGALLGAQDPQLQKITQIQQLSSQFDLTSPTGMREFAKSLQQIAPNESMMAAREAERMEQAGLTRKKTTADIELQERKVSQDEKLREALSKLPENATDAQYLQVFRQFGSPDQQARAIEAAAARRERLAAKTAGEGDGLGKPGPVGKGGAYRDISGTIFGPTEMKPIRQEFEGAQKLLDTLNQVKASDVKDAESIIDWTTKGETKALASKKTLMAQTKIAASQLMEQIGQLPPGSASDADMRASMKSFPGYSNAEALAEWVNETKRKLQFNINRGQDQFGFKSRVEPTPPLDLKKKKPTGQTTQSDDALINKYIKAKTQ